MNYKFKKGDKVVVVKTRGMGGILAKSYKLGDEAIAQGNGYFRFPNGISQSNESEDCFALVEDIKVGDKAVVTDIRGHCFKLGAIVKCVKASDDCGWTEFRGVSRNLGSECNQSLERGQWETVKDPFETETEPTINGTKQVGGTHYQSYAIEPIEFIVANDVPYREANVIKYVVRHKDKNGAEDIKKAIHYLEMILEDYKDAS